MFMFCFRSSGRVGGQGGVCVCVCGRGGGGGRGVGLIFHNFAIIEATSLKVRDKTADTQIIL